MLNILMSFAQFEREMTADRIRDKIYASRKRGMWTGGPTPYGYILEDKQLKVEPKAAEVVRWIFRRYAATGSSLQVAKELNESPNRRADGQPWRPRMVLSCSFQNRTGVVFKTGLFRQLRTAWFY